MVDTCPHCGAFIIPQDYVTGPVRRRILDFLRRRKGVLTQASDIADFVYQDRPNGGPEYNNISVIIGLMNKQLRPRGLKIQGRKGPGGGYQLIQVDPTK